MRSGGKGFFETYQPINVSQGLKEGPNNKPPLTRINNLTSVLRGLSAEVEVMAYSTQMGTRTSGVQSCVFKLEPILDGMYLWKGYALGMDVSSHRIVVDWWPCHEVRMRHMTLQSHSFFHPWRTSVKMSCKNGQNKPTKPCKQTTTTSQQHKQNIIPSCPEIVQKIQQNREISKIHAGQ